MLTELRISRFALIDSLALEFAPGFQVFTGETGAGKSLLVDALLLLLGGRASAGHVRHGAREAVLEAVFTVDHPAILSRLEAWDLLPGDMHELFLRRVISGEGRSRMYVNGTLVPLHQMVELGGYLVDIHGQHDQQSLLSPQVQLRALDEFGGLVKLRDEYVGSHRRWRALVRDMEDLTRRVGERVEREDLLRFQNAELTGARLTPGEDEDLIQEHRALQNRGRLMALASQACDLLYRDQGAILARLSEVKKLVQEVGTLDETTRPWSEWADSGIAQLEELALALRRYTDGVHLDHPTQAGVVCEAGLPCADSGDPGLSRLAWIDERLALLQGLKKKYRASLEELIARRARVQSELEALATQGDNLERLQQSVSRAYDDARALAQKLSLSRRAVAREFEKSIAAELPHLKLEHATFGVELTDVPHTDGLGQHGLDQVRFVLCANAGERAQPLARVASGGELSRLMLAMKTVLAGTDQVPVLVFDEVDTGIGGNVASAVGQRLGALGRAHQVLCITHLPQIAAQAGHHYLVEKVREDMRTVITVRPLRGEDREQEIARMLGGATITQAVKKAAGEMLNPT